MKNKISGENFAEKIAEKSCSGAEKIEQKFCAADFKNGEKFLKNEKICGEKKILKNKISGENFAENFSKNRKYFLKKIVAKKLKKIIF